VDFFRRLFSSDFVPHGNCFFWRPELVWLHAISDTAIALAYYSIPVTLFFVIWRRAPQRWRGLMAMFGAFALACGTTHLLAVWNIWHSAYRLEGVVKALTAALSIATAILTMKVAPLALSIATPDELARANQKLRDEMEARSEAEQRLRQWAEADRISSEATISSYLEAASQGVIVVGGDGRITLVNRRTEEMFGYSRQELLGQNLEVLVPERYRHMHIRYRQDFFLDPSIRSMGAGRDLSGLRKDGSEFPVEIGLSFIGSGDATIALGLVSDITDRKRAADELERSHAELRSREAELRSYLEGAAQAIVAVSNEGLIVLVNRKTEEMFGYDREELLGQELGTLLPERIREIHQKHRAHFFVEPRVRSMGVGMELAGRRKDGTEFPVEIGLSFVGTEQGGMALGMITDITERKRTMDELARLNERLRRGNMELEQFAYIASHDLQEPLRMVTSYLNLLELRYRNKLDSEAGEFIHYAVDGAERMKGLIRDVLRFSRAGTQAVTLSQVSAERIVEQAIENVQTAIEERGAKVHVGTLPKITADAHMLTHVFQNLIANGIKFTKDATPEIHIAAEKRNGDWIFSVHDNGIGIEERHIPRIFVLFERLNSSEEYGGTGVGLAICKKIVERHEGRIWVESAPGRGSTFYFSIPENALLQSEKSAVLL
jgi:PAS domain S-box-containing protein